MAELQWLESMSVGIAEFDDAHKGFIAALHEIAAALEAGRPDEAERLGLAFFAVAQEHANRELGFLARHGYPGIDLVRKTQLTTQTRILSLLTAIQADPAAALAMIGDMQQMVVAYLLRGDINFKSFVQDLRDQGRPVDTLPSEKD